MNQNIPLENNTQENSNKRPRERANDYLLSGSIVFAALLIAGSIFYFAQNNGESGSADGYGAAMKDVLPSPSADLSITERDVVLGESNAPVTFIEYADYQCPFCGRLYDQVEKNLRDDYIKPGKVKMVFRNFQFLGPESIAAAEAAECAKDEGKFWGYHDEIYEEELADNQENNGNLNRDLFIRIARRLGLDEAKFVSCVDSHKYGDLIKQAVAAGQALGVNSTPTNFINGQKIMGAQPYPTFVQAIESALKTR